MMKNKYYEIEVIGEGAHWIYEIAAPNMAEAKKRAWNKHKNRRVFKKDFSFYGQMVYDPEKQC